MTREEAIHRLKNTAWLGTNKDREETEQAVDMAIEALSEEPPYQYSKAYVEQIRGERDILQDMVDNMAKPKTGWIPCSERLPLVGGEFLVTLVDNDGTWVSTAQWNMTFGGRWQDIFPNDGYRDISNVIAWKTLPIPYREDGEA